MMHSPASLLETALHHYCNIFSQSVSHRARASVTVYMKHYNGENVSDVDGSETCLSVTETSHIWVFHAQQSIKLT